MSVAELLENKHKPWLNIRVNSIVVDTSILAPVVGFRFSLHGGSTLSVPTGYATGTFLVNYGAASTDTVNYNSPDFNITTGIYTIPISGFWKLTAGIFYGAFAGASDSIYYVGIAPPGDTSNPYIVATAFETHALLQNWANQCTDTIYLAAGTQLQVFTQHGSGSTETLSTSPYNFFSGYLVSNSTHSLS